MAEIDVILTDYVLAVECTVLAVLLYRARVGEPNLRRWLTTFFGSVGVASLLGGTYHGFFSGGQLFGSILWSTTLLAIGVNALSAWIIGAQLIFPMHIARLITAAAGVLFAIYCVAVLVVTTKFWIAILDYAPAGLFLLIALWQVYKSIAQKALLLAAGGIALSFVAALLQQFKIGIHPAYFTHNALYHVLQGIALFLFYLGGRWLLAHEWRVLKMGGADHTRQALEQ